MATKKASQKKKSDTKAKAKVTRETKTVQSGDFLTLYSNNVQLVFSKWDLRMSFGRIQEATKETLVVHQDVEIYMSPQHAAAFHQTLGDVLKKYQSLHEPTTSGLPS